MKNFYLITLAHNSSTPINHGLVAIDDRGFIDGETPVEDFGMFYMREEPFPENERDIVNIFIDLMEN